MNKAKKFALWLRENYNDSIVDGWTCKKTNKIFYYSQINELYQLFKKESDLVKPF